MKKYLIFILSLFSILFVGCDIGLTPSNPIENDPPVNEIKHKITFHLDNKMTMEETEIEYVEGVGLETLPIPIIDNEDRIEEFETIFIYWIGSIDGNEPSLKIDSYDNEVFVSISKEETRDLDLYPRTTTRREYDLHFPRYNQNIEEGIEYPPVVYIIDRRDIVDKLIFPHFNRYGKIMLDRTINDEKVTIDNKTYYRVSCYLLDIYDELRLKDYLNITNYDYGIDFYGNCNIDGSFQDITYFVNVPDFVYENIVDCDEFIIPLNIEYDVYYKADELSIVLWSIQFPDISDPIGEFKYEIIDNNFYLDFYPIVNGIVKIEDHKEYINRSYSVMPYIEMTYKTYMNHNIDANPTFEYFDKWLIESFIRMNKRVQYNQGCNYW